MPGIGRKTALRLALHLLRQDVEASDALARALTEMRHGIRYCSVCHNISQEPVCPICSSAMRDRSAVRVVETVTEQTRSMESVVTFRQGKSTVDNAQLPNVERVATYLNNHKDATVIIRGFASPEGSQEVNERIAKARAEAVKDILVKRYRINASRIDAQGNGVGDMFSEPDWNRVSICTIDDKEK